MQTGGFRQNGGSCSFGQLSPYDFQRLSEFIYHTFGIKILEKKRYLLQNRLVKRLKALNLDNYSDYTDYVLNGNHGGDEVYQMIDVVSTNKTDFFRERAHFDFLSEAVLPDFQGTSIQAWSAGCSTGQEAYSLCMVFEEFRQKGNIQDYIVYGNDISNGALQKAIKAIYPYKEVSPISSEYRKKYLLKSKDTTEPKIRIVPKLREKTSFVRMNLADNIYNLPRNFHIVFCRNTLIYFDRKSQQKVIDRLTEHLLKGGYLFVGHSESLINMHTDGLQLIKPAIYQKI